MLAQRAKLILGTLLLLALFGCESVGTASTVPPDKQKALDAHLRAGFEYMKLDNRDGARRHFEKALSIAPESPEANNGMAVLFQLNGEADLAEQRFKKALQRKPDFTQAQYNYGMFLFTQSRFQDAYEQFEKVVKDLSYDRRAFSLAILGQLAQKLDKPEKARSSYEHALNIDSTLPLALINLAELHFDQGDYAKANNYLKRFERNVQKRTAQSLWLGIRLERLFGNEDKKASYILALKNLHPYSKEYLLYKQSLESDANNE